MKNIMDQWIANSAIAFVIRQVTKFGTETDFAKIKADLAIRVADLIPGKWWDAEAIEITNAIVDACERALKNTKTLKIILDLLVAQKHTEALTALRDYLLKSWKPGNDVAAVKAMALLETNKLLAS